MKIKITKKLLKEAESDRTWPPKKKPTTTWRKGPEAETTIPKPKSDHEPTEKAGDLEVDTEIPMPPSPIGQRTEKVPLRQAILNRLKSAMTPGRESYTDEEADELDAAHMRKIRKAKGPSEEGGLLPDFSGSSISAEKEFGIPDLPPAASVPLEEPELMDDPEQEEEIDYDDKFQPLQEIARRHFKKG